MADAINRNLAARPSAEDLQAAAQQHRHHHHRQQQQHRHPPPPTTTDHNNTTSRAQQQDKGIIKGGAGVSPRLSEASEQLAKQVRPTQTYARDPPPAPSTWHRARAVHVAQMRADSLNSWLAGRPSAEDLWQGPLM